MQLSIRQATLEDIDVLTEILREAAGWLEDSGMPMWRQDELELNNVAAEVQSGLFFLADCDDEQQGRSDTSLRINCFGLMCRRATRRSFIDSPSKDVSPAEKSPRLSSFGPSRALTLSELS